MAFTPRGKGNLRNNNRKPREASLFKRNGKSQSGVAEEGQTELYEQIGRLKMELEWLKKKVTRSSGGKTRTD